MSLSKSLEKLKFDTRMIDINMKNGTLDKSEYDQYLSTLENTESNAAQLDFKHEMGSPADVKSDQGHPEGH